MHKVNSFHCTNSYIISSCFSIYTEIKLFIYLSLVFDKFSKKRRYTAITKSDIHLFTFFVG